MTSKISDVDRDRLFDKQHELGEAIHRGFINYAKLTKNERSNLPTINRKINKISSLYEEFAANDMLLQQVTKDGSYFEDSYFSNVTILYEKGMEKPLADKARVQKIIADSEFAGAQSQQLFEFVNENIDIPEDLNGAGIESASGGSTTENIRCSMSSTGATKKGVFANTENISSDAERKENSELIKLIKMQRSSFYMLKNKIQKIRSYKVETLTSEKIQITVNGLSGQWDTVVENNRKIFAINDDLKDPLPLNYTYQSYSDLEDEIERCITQLLEIKAASEGDHNRSTPQVYQVQNVHSSNSLHGMVHLPKIEIPKFDGNPLKWNGFRNLFVQMIDSAEISDAQKLFYLKSNLTGPAASLVTIFDTNVDTYKQAWERIESKYNNPRMLTNAIADKLYSQSNMKEENAEGLRGLRDITKECFASLKNLGIEVDKCESMFVYLLLKKLDPKSREQFEYSLKNPKDNPSLQLLYDFLDKRSQALDGLVKQPKSMKVVHVTAAKPRAESNNNNKNNGSCICCKDGNHSLGDCKKFCNLNLRNKWMVIKRNQICCRCLLKGHFSTQCEKDKCSMCGGNHHKVLHVEKKENPKDPKESGKVVLSLQKQVCFNNLNCSEDGFVFLGTAMLYIVDNRGKKILCRAILDSCSQVNLISHKLSKRLGLRRLQHSTNILGVGEGDPLVCRERMVLEVSSIDGSFVRVLSSLIIHSLTKYKPQEEFVLANVDMEGIDLADPSFGKPDSIDILLGAGIFPSLLSNESIDLGPGLPQLVKTVFGWIVMGIYSKSSIEDEFQCLLAVNENVEFEENAPRLWDMEEPDNKVLSVEEEMAVKEFDRTTIRNKEGRFVVKLPKSKSVSALGESYSIALKRFISLEKRFSKDPSLFDQYYTFLNEYYQLDHMEKISLKDIPSFAILYFIPHHAVMKLESTTTKLRVVFDASCCTTTKLSLNNILLKGPVVQPELFELLIRFRFPRYTMSADIEKMYRQILVDEDDRHLQLILWRNNPSLPISVFRLKTVTYGTTPAPFLATKCLLTLGEEYSQKCPLASKVLQNDFYVDDVITGFDDINTAIQVQRELIDILSGAGFHLRKWCSNHPSLLQNVPEIDQEIQWSPKTVFDSVKTLGVIWNPKNDCFSLKTSCIRNETPITKRQISSESGSIFDPLGFVNPFVVKAKLIIQELWKQHIDWDDEVPESIAKAWIHFRKELNHLRNFSIPRHVLCVDFERVELHGFADASAKAYGAVIYIRSLSRNGVIQTNFLCSKSKVAPIGSVTIPKLELSAARLLAELVFKVKSCIEYTIHEIYYWSDSEITLWWIQKNPGSFKPFVSNRVKAIQFLTKTEQWHHIQGDENPADIISRGMDVKDLMDSSLWLDGPSFLKNSANDWPQGQKFGDSFKKSDACKELRKVTVMKCLTDFNQYNFLESINHRNSFLVLQRIVAFLIRFKRACSSRTVDKIFLEKRFREIVSCSNLRGYVLENSKPLSVNELDEAMKCIVRYLQKEYMIQEDMAKGLKTLLPFKDNQGIIRVGGRLKNSHLPFDAKHPMLLPNCKVTDLLVEKIHIDNLHAAPLALLSFVRQRFWPLQGRRTCTKIFHRCIPCFKKKPKNIHQLMGDLPRERTCLIAPFKHTGVDYAGPFNIHYRLRGKRPTKAYLAVFVCFAVKAVHLEVVTDLTTEAFLGCLKRFVSRRGKPDQIYSDNATNFVGAKRELRELADFLKGVNEKVVEFSASKGVVWSTIPAGSPHFGGLWEAAVKRAKYYLMHCLKNVNLTFEELNTVVIEVESILNSRPLCPLSDDPNDFVALTPNHFLIPGCSELIPDKNFLEGKGKLLKRWDLVSKLRVDLWQDFNKFYLHNLQERKKWNECSENVKEDQLVIINNKGALTNNWEMGRVIKAIPGDDGLVRVLDIKTPNGVKRRAVTKVAPLPLASEYDELKVVDKINNMEGNVKRTNFKSNHNFVLSLCFFLLMFPFVLGSNAVNISTFQHKPGIYFDGIGEINILKDKWHLITYYNLTNFWNQCSDFEYLVGRTKSLCNEPLCLDMLKELESRLKNIEQLDTLIKEECHMRELNRRHNIGKRSYDAPLNVIGNIAHSLFGTLDSKYADKMENTLANVKSNEDRLMLLIKNHTTIIDQTLKVVKRNNQEVQQQFDKLSSETISMAALQKKESRRVLFNSIVNFLLLRMIEYREIQLQLHDMMLDFKKKKLNPFLISPSELESHIREMENTIGANYKLPSSHYAELETVVQLAVVHGNSCLMFHIEIPLMTHDNFELYRMIPIPTFERQQYRFIKPTDDYLAIDKHRKFYYLLDSEELKECNQFYDIRLCYQNQALYPANDNNHCEVNIFLGLDKLTQHCDLRQGLHNEYWIALHKMNQWLFSVMNKVEASVTCVSNRSYLEKITLSGEGIMEIHPSCTLDAPGIQIPGKSILHSRLFLKSIPSILPKLNINETTVTSKSNAPILLKLENLDAISSAVERAKVDEAVELKSIGFEDGPDAYHYLSFGISGFLLIIGILLFTYLICSRKSKDQPAITVKTEIPRTRSRFALSPEEIEY